MFTSAPNLISSTDAYVECLSWLISILKRTECILRWIPSILNNKSSIQLSFLPSLIKLLVAEKVNRHNSIIPRFDVMSKIGTCTMMIFRALLYFRCNGRQFLTFHQNLLFLEDSSYSLVPSSFFFAVKMPWFHAVSLFLFRHSDRNHGKASIERECANSFESSHDLSSSWS